MTWRQELRPASFRGLAFDVEGDSSTFGRRTQVHEYPQRDKPWAEDLGRATRQISLTAFLIGDDYLRRRDALLAALETKGPGTLVHPWYGELQVSVREPASVTHSHKNGGMCEIALSFVEAGELQFPAASASLGAQSLVAADVLGDASILDFAKGAGFSGLPSFSLDGLPSFSLDGLPSFGLETLVGDITRFGGMVTGAVGGLGLLRGLVPTWVSDLVTTGGALLNSVDRARLFATSVIGMFNRGALDAAPRTSRLSTDSGAADAADGAPRSSRGAVLPDTAAGAARLNRNAVIALTGLSREFERYVAAPTSTAPATRQVQANTVAVAQLYQRAALIQAAGMASAMPLPVYDDAVLVRDSVAAAVEAASLEASDPMYVALQVLRARSHADITARLSQSARLLQYTPREPMPGLAIAYDLYEDAARELELIERNAIRHPGFVPAQAVRVLSQ